MLTCLTNPHGFLYQNQDKQFRNSQNLSKYLLFLSFSANADLLIFHEPFAGLMAAKGTKCWSFPFSYKFGVLTCQTNCSSRPFTNFLWLLFPKTGSWETDLFCTTYWEWREVLWLVRLMAQYSQTTKVLFLKKPAPWHPHPLPSQRSSSHWPRVQFGWLCVLSVTNSSITHTGKYTIRDLSFLKASYKTFS